MYACIYTYIQRHIHICICICMHVCMLHFSPHSHRWKFGDKGNRIQITRIILEKKCWISYKVWVWVDVTMDQKLVDRLDNYIQIENEWLQLKSRFVIFLRMNCPFLLFFCFLLLYSWEGNSEWRTVVESEFVILSGELTKSSFYCLICMIVRHKFLIYYITPLYDKTMICMFIVLWSYQ